MKQENVETFRREAAEECLIFADHSYYRRLTKYIPRFVFDLNQGEITLLEPDPVRVMQLVRLARKYAESETYGEHNALLHLVVKKTNLEALQVFWQRSYYGSGQDRGSFITLADWLEESGQNLEIKSLLMA